MQQFHQQVATPNSQQSSAEPPQGRTLVLPTVTFRKQAQRYSIASRSSLRLPHYHFYFYFAVFLLGKTQTKQKHKPNKS